MFFIQTFTDDIVAHFIDAINLKYSNWLRFINMPNEERDENVSSHFCVGRIFYRTIIDLYPGQELYVNYAYYNEKADMSSSDKVKSEWVTNNYYFSLIITSWIRKHTYWHSLTHSLTVISNHVYTYPLYVDIFSQINKYNKANCFLVVYKYFVKNNRCCLIIQNVHVCYKLIFLDARSRWKWHSGFRK